MNHYRTGRDTQLSCDGLRGMPTQKQLCNFPFALRQRGLTKILKTSRQALVHTLIATVAWPVSGKSVPHLLHGGPDDRLDQAQAIQLGP